MKLILMRTLCVSAAAMMLSALTPTSTTAQVVDLAAGGANDYYANWSTDGNANATTPGASSYNNYRKGGAPSPPGLPVAADFGDGLAGEWTNISHGGAIACCGNPGMFFGASPSTSSYSDAVFFVRDNTEVGNANNNDSNGRRQFDLRFGFTESPDDWVAGKDSSGGDYDLWAADHGSDTIYLNFQVGATDEVGNGLVRDTANGGNLIDETNQFVNLSAALKGQSGATPDAFFRDERDRNRWIGDGIGNILQTENTFATEPVTVRDLDQPALSLSISSTNAGVADGQNARFDSGVAYDGDVPISWKMEAIDPGNADPVLARMVNFVITAGSVEYTQAFDPGSAADPMTPNPSFDGANTFEDGFFDWENATPIFFVGPNGGATTAGSLRLGFTGPAVEFDYGDFDKDGDVDIVDFGTFGQNFGLTGGDILNPEADSEPDGDVDIVDFGNFSQNFGNGTGSGSGVPEPASAAIAMIAFALLGLRRRS